MVAAAAVSVAILAAMAGAAWPALMEHAAAMDLERRLSPPGAAGLLGSDQLGRDILARLAAGTPWSLGVAGAATLIALVIGTVLGLAAAELDGVARRVILQVVTLTLSFPGLVAALAAVAVLGQSAAAVVIVLGLLSWPLFARVVYAEALSARERPYVTAARLGGVGRARILWRHVTPALRPSLTAMTAFHFADMLVAASALTFLGVGAPLGSPAWGVMLSEARPYLYDAPWMLIAPAAALASTVLALNLAGDALSRALGVAGRPGLLR